MCKIHLLFRFYFSSPNEYGFGCFLHISKQNRMTVIQNEICILLDYLNLKLSLIECFSVINVCIQT